MQAAHNLIKIFALVLGTGKVGFFFFFFLPALQETDSILEALGGSPWRFEMERLHGPFFQGSMSPPCNFAALGRILDTGS